MTGPRHLANTLRRPRIRRESALSALQRPFRADQAVRLRGGLSCHLCGMSAAKKPQSAATGLED